METFASVWTPSRNNSAVSLWPNSDITKSREACLAEQVSRSRKSRQGGGGEKRTTTRRRTHGIDDSDKNNSQHSFPSRRHRCLFRSTGRSASSQRHPPRCHSPRPLSRCPDETARQRNILRVFRGLRHRDVGTEDHGWSLERIVRSERHPVFVQPVKKICHKTMEFLSVEKPQPFLYANFGWEQRKMSGLSTYHIKHFGRINTTESSYSNNDNDSVQWEFFGHVARQSF